VIETPFGSLSFSGGDRVPLSLRDEDRAVIETAAAANPRTAVVLIGGSAITLSEWERRVPAILMAWYNGMEGGRALPRVLFGDVNPSGRLPITIPRDEGQLPPFDEFAEEVEYGYFHGYTLLDHLGEEPAYAFGFGLSYTHFSYASLEVAPARIPADGTLEASVALTNTGSRAGEEVVQLYVGFEGAPVERPVKLLRGFRKLSLEPGETRRVSFRLAARDLARYDPEARAWRVDAMPYQLYVGGSSRNADLLQAGFSVRDAEPAP
jgi:beta-glucosidase